jgi:hypothetical protein
MAAGTAIFVMWGGRTRKWRPPDRDLPGTARSFVLLLCGAFMVVVFYFAELIYLSWMISSVALFAILAMLFYLSYSSLIGTYGFRVPRPTKRDPKAEALVLGGRKLTQAAQKWVDKLGIGVPELLAGAQYKVDSLWDRDAQQWVKTRALLFFILMLAFGTTALTTAAFATQVILTKKAATSFIRIQDAPGPHK